MKILEFLQTFREFPAFSTAEIEKRYPGFERENLQNWQKKGYLRRIRNGWYSLSDGIRSLADLYFVSNKIYAPSYISLESALGHYGWIPEGVFLITAVTTQKTANFDSVVGHFRYASVKPSLFFGYSILTENGRGIKMAEPEKALLDFLYFHPELREPEDFEAFRLNLFQMKATLNWQKTQDYAALFDSKALGARLLTFQKLLDDAESY